MGASFSRVEKQKTGGDAVLTETVPMALQETVNANFVSLGYGSKGF